MSWQLTRLRPSAAVTSTISNAANYVGETAKEMAYGTSKEANKEVAKDSSVPIADRASAGFDAVSDKINESSHGAKADGHKEMAKH